MIKKNASQSDRSDAKVFSWILALAIVLVSGGIAWVGWHCIDSVQKKDSPRYEQAKKELSAQTVTDQMSPTHLVQEFSRNPLAGSEIVYSRGFEASEKGLYSQAEKEYSQVLVMIPAEAKRKKTWKAQGCVADRTYYTRLTYQDRSYCYLQDRQYSLAVADLNEAIKLDPDYEVNYENRAKAHFLLGHKALATEDMKTLRALQLKHKNSGPATVP